MKKANIAFYGYLIYVACLLLIVYYYLHYT